MTLLFTGAAVVGGVTLEIPNATLTFGSFVPEITTASFPTPPNANLVFQGFPIGVSAPLLTHFVERFEAAPGYDATWSSAVVVDGGSTFDPDASPSGAGSPPTFSTQCLKIIHNSGSNAYRPHGFPAGIEDFQLSLDFCYLTDTLAPNQSVPFLLVFHGAGPAYLVVIAKDANGNLLIVVASFGALGGAETLFSTAIVPGSIYRFRAIWNVPIAQVQFDLDGTTFGGQPLEVPAGIVALVLGCLGGTFVTSTFYLDNLVVTSGAFLSDPSLIMPLPANLRFQGLAPHLGGGDLSGASIYRYRYRYSTQW